jgi:hypothetical protein
MEHSLSTCFPTRRRQSSDRGETWGSRQSAQEIADVAQALARKTTSSRFRSSSLLLSLSAVHA